MTETTETADLVRRLRVKAGMLRMGERIAFGSDADALEDAADAIERLTRERDEARAVFDVKTASQIIAALQEADLRSKDRIAKLEAALDSLARDQQSEAQAGTGEYQRGYDDCIADHADRARAALEGKP
jgi:hypothetical protein